MRTFMFSALAVPAAAALLAGCAATSTAPDDTPFGGPQSVAYAQKLWAALGAAGLAGAEGIVSKPYQGQHPHGAVLDTVEGTLEVGGHRGAVIVKRNYGGPDVSVSKVADDPARYLGAVTVMFRRERGYDADNQDWFWAKYKPDGSLDRNPKGMQLAGRVAKGAAKGCIACHRTAPGGDLVFNNDRHAR